MSETAKNIRSISRENILVPVTDKGFSKEDIKISALIRIADALETITESTGSLLLTNRKLQKENDVLKKNLYSKTQTASRYKTLYEQSKKPDHV